MRFRLTYEGDLYSRQKRNLSDHKHDIRKHFHPQLKQLWNKHQSLSMPSGGCDWANGNDGERGGGQAVALSGFDRWRVGLLKDGIQIHNSAKLERAGCLQEPSVLQKESVFLPRKLGQIVHV